MQYNDSSYHLFHNKNIYIDKIIKCSKESISDLEKEFIRLFYWQVAMLNITEKEITHFSYFSEKAFSFISNLSNDQTKLEIYSPDFLEYNHKFTVIQLVSKDIPFLVDSIVSAIGKKGLEIYRVIYPSIQVKRDNKGNLVNIFESNPEDGSMREVIIHIHLQHIDKSKDAEALKNHLNNIVENVKFAVSDWKHMIARVHEHTLFFQEKAKSDEHFLEQAEFLASIESKYFVFTGLINYNFTKTKNQYKAEIDKDSALGILKVDHELMTILEDTIFNQGQLSGKQQYINIGKLNKASIIHRDVNLDYICIKTFDEQDNLIKAVVCIGLFTSILYYQSATLIPIIKRKVTAVLKEANFSPSSHGGKELVSIIESLPRDELFQIQVDELFKIVMEVYALMYFPDLRLFIRHNEGGKFASCLVFIPHERIKAEISDKIHSVITAKLGNIITSNYVHINNSQMCYYHIIVDLNKNMAKNLDCAALEHELDEVTFLWKENLRQYLFNEHGISGGDSYYQEYSNAFPESYKERYKPGPETIEDISYFSKVKSDGKVIFRLSNTCLDEFCSIRLKIYSDFEIPLSSVMPMIHDIGFSALAEHIFKIETESKKTLWLHNFYLNSKECKISDLENVRTNVEDTLSAIWSGKAISDEYNKLILSSGLIYREVSLLRAIGKYLYQIKFGYSKEYIGSVLTRNPSISKLIIEAFKSKFNPELKENQRQKKYQDTKESIEHKLNDVSDPLEDRVIRRYIEIIDAMVRTNYYCLDVDGNHKNYISFKINSRQVSNLPKPVPFMEVFVYSSRFEAIHLRSAKVSRGGIRWSDRSEDFRTEVLGLMKAQIPKNSVIVPGGAKGGFVINQSLEMTRDEFFKVGVECYREFLHGLLDITDNMEDGTVIHPKNVVCLDQEDPYLVVAADKGTATFSDIANQISADYNFWLGDAFASGGSAGYDHKKMAITAKGAWISVERHFMEMGKDINENDFTVIGIGDMSGDVFGNGMLLSNHIKLLAAFNHMHIFVDPDPDSAKSFLERKRLFNLKGSSWADYDKNILSKGAQIYERKAKSLELTKEIQHRFNIPNKNIAPEELMSIILKADVDLLWNGGIGTYVKSSTEDNADVGDKANDNLRVNGKDLRCKIVGEGGNLGFTQAGRIEYARNAGRINTDAIDNSAGVDCSDHEVNIKIVLEKIFKTKKIDLASRNKLLEEMTEDVAELVLRDNRLQTLALSITEFRGYSQLSAQERLIEMLEKEGRIDRKQQCLPSRDDFAHLHASKQPLTRPELAVLLAQTKLSVFDNLMSAKLPDDSYFDSALAEYFPKLMQKKYFEEIMSHPLRREIIATVVTNCMINRVAPHFVHLTSVDTGLEFCDLSRAYIITRDIFELGSLWNEIEKLDQNISPRIKLKMNVEVKKFVMRSSLWLIRSLVNKDIKTCIATYKSGMKQLISIIEKFITGPAKDNYNLTIARFVNAGVPDSIAKKVSLLRPLSSGYNIINIANVVNLPLEKITELYFNIGYLFNLEWLRISSAKLPILNNWQRLSARAFKDELYDIHGELTQNVLEYSTSKRVSKEEWFKINEKRIDRYSKYMHSIMESDHIEYAMLNLALKHLKSMLMR